MKYRRLTDGETKFVRINYPIYGGNYCIQYLKVEKGSVLACIRRLKLHFNKPKFPEGYRKCTKCSEMLKTENFYTNSRYGNPISYCKKCHGKATKKYKENRILTEDQKRNCLVNYILSNARHRAKKTKS